MDALLQGLTVSAIGLLLTFGALGMLIIVIALMMWIFSPREGPRRAVFPADAPAPRAEADEDAAVAAAVSVAFGYWRAQDLARSGLGQSLRAGRGAWWSPASDTGGEGRRGA